MPDTSGPNQLNPGDLLSRRYRIERSLGEGGFGRVYAAHDLDLDIPVALKVRRIPGPDQRLWREAKAGARLCSPFSVRVYNIEQLDDGTPYIVMERLPGQSLREYLKTHGTVVPELATRWVLELCDALGEAHRLHQVHRDVKPSNLFLVERPPAPTQLKLLDFGLTKTLNDAVDDTLTESGVVLGSPAYMSPEQVRGAEVTAQSDVWSTGVVLYEMLTGRRPFEATTTAAILAAIAADTPAPLREVAPNLPPEFDGIIHRCLRKCTSERYPSVAALASDLSKRVASSTHGDSGMITSVSVTAALAPYDHPRASFVTPRRVTWATLALVALAGAGLVAFPDPPAAVPHEKPAATQATAVRPEPVGPASASALPPFDLHATTTPTSATSIPKPLRAIARPATSPQATGQSPDSQSEAALGLFRDPDF